MINMPSICEDVEDLTLEINDIIIKESKNEKSDIYPDIFSIKHPKKEIYYHIYIKIKKKIFPVNMPDYQRSDENKEVRDRNRFINAVLNNPNRPMEPLPRINLGKTEDGKDKNNIYAIIMDGQQRITLVAKIKEKIYQKTNKDDFDLYDKWTQDEKNRFNSYKIKIHLFQDATYEQEQKEFDTVNGENKHLKAADKRKTKIGKQDKERIKKLTKHTMLLYNLKDDNSGYESVYRVVSHHIYSKGSDFKNIINLTNINNGNILKVIDYIKAISEEDFKILRSDIRNLCETVHTILGNESNKLKENKNEENHFSANTGYTKKGVTDVVVLAISYLINQGFLEDLKDNDDKVYNVIIGYLNEKEIRGNSSYTTINKHAKELVERISEINFD